MGELGNPVEFPNYIDTLPSVWFLEMDDVAPVVVGIYVGMFLKFFNPDWTSAVMYTTPLGFVGMYYYIKYKRNALTGVLNHIVYCYCFMPLNKRYDKGYVKRLEN